MSIDEVTRKTSVHAVSYVYASQPTGMPLLPVKGGLSCFPELYLRPYVEPFGTEMRLFSLSGDRQFEAPC